MKNRIGNRCPIENISLDRSEKTNHQLVKGCDLARSGAGGTGDPSVPLTVRTTNPATITGTPHANGPETHGSVSTPCSRNCFRSFQKSITHAGSTSGSARTLTESTANNSLAGTTGTGLHAFGVGNSQTFVPFFKFARSLDRNFPDSWRSALIIDRPTPKRFSSTSDQSFFVMRP